MPHPLNPLVFSEKFFCSWSRPAKMFRQFGALVALGLVDYRFGVAGMKSESASLVFLGFAPIAATAIFVLAFVRNLSRFLPKPGQRFAIITLFASSFAFYQNSNFPDAYSWAAIATAVVGIVLLIDLINAQESEQTFDETARQQ